MAFCQGIQSLFAVKKFKSPQKKNINCEYDITSDLQAGIWFGTMALSPIMTLPRLHYCLVVFAFNLVFYTHMRMRNTAYSSFHHVEFFLRLRQLMTFPVWG